jgi:hypothetical protein
MCTFTRLRVLYRRRFFSVVFCSSVRTSMPVVSKGKHSQCFCSRSVNSRLDTAATFYTLRTRFARLSRPDVPWQRRRRVLIITSLLYIRCLRIIGTSMLSLSDGTSVERMTVKWLFFFLIFIREILCADEQWFFFFLISLFFEPIPPDVYIYILLYFFHKPSVQRVRARIESSSG